MPAQDADDDVRAGTVVGRLVTGLGEAAGFTRLDWVRRQLLELAGIDPHPGTVNLTVDDPADLLRWRAWRGLAGHAVAPEAGFCSARCHRVTLAGRIPAALIVPDMPDYPHDKIELVAALPVREHLSLGEGAQLGVTLCRPLAAKAVLFDIDGTLVDSMGAYFEVARLAAAPQGLVVTEEHVRRCLAAGSHFWKGLVPEDRADRDEFIKALSAHASREWPRVLLEHGRVFDGLAQVLDTLQASGIALGIVSGARPEVLELLRPQGILARFHAVVLGADVLRRKPDPEGLLQCLAKLGVPPGSAIYVGDSDVDIAAGRAAGVGTVGVLTGAASGAMLSRCGPDRLIADLSRLPGLLA